jgi:hypothetical protein
MVRKDAFDPRLRTHKLKGELSAYWAYSVNREYRVLFRFLGPSEAKFIVNVQTPKAFIRGRWHAGHNLCKRVPEQRSQK